MSSQVKFTNVSVNKVIDIMNYTESNMKVNKGLGDDPLGLDGAGTGAPIDLLTVETSSLLNDANT